MSSVQWPVGCVCVVLGCEGWGYHFVGFAGTAACYYCCKAVIGMLSRLLPRAFTTSQMHNTPACPLSTHTPTWVDNVVVHNRQEPVEPAGASVLSSTEVCRACAESAADTAENRTQFEAPTQLLTHRHAELDRFTVHPARHTRTHTLLPLCALTRRPLPCAESGGEPPSQCLRCCWLLPVWLVGGERWWWLRVGGAEWSSAQASKLPVEVQTVVPCYPGALLAGAFDTDAVQARAHTHPRVDLHEACIVLSKAGRHSAHTPLLLLLLLEGQDSCSHMPLPVAVADLAELLLQHSFWIFLIWCFVVGGV